MIFPLVYPTAADIWFNGSIDSDPYSLSQRELSALPKKYRISSSQSIIQSLIQSYRLTPPVHLLAADDSLRIHRNNIVCAIRSAHVPEKCFIKIESPVSDISVYLACPEYCFLQAAANMNLLDLIYFGYNLCARYMKDPTVKYGQHQRLPLTNKNSIQNFINRCSNAKGVRKARKAISYVLDNSNSPMESGMSMAVFLPFSQGGFSIHSPELNQDVNLSFKGRELLQRDSCCCDMVWEKEKLIVEYDSTLTHLESTQHEIDKKRITALTLSGYRVLTITVANFRNFSAFENTFMAIRWSLGYNKKSDLLSKYRDKRYELFRFIIGSHENHFKF